jgi:alpha,alpha-trehalose phosphorylase
MIEGPRFRVDPWCLCEQSLDMEHLAQTESVFTLANGHIGVRGNLDEGEPHGLPGTYLNSFYESRPLPYGEAGYGYPEAGQTIVNVTNGKVIRLLVDDELLDVRYGALLAHERVLDFRSGTLRRCLEWRSPRGQRVLVRSTRLVSLTQRSVMAVDYQVEVLDGPARVVVQSELIANEELPVLGPDPRVAAALSRPLRLIESGVEERRVYAAHRTERSGLRMAAMMDHRLEGPDGMQDRSEWYQDVGRLTVIARMQPGEILRIQKLVTYGWSSARSVPSLRDQVAAALDAGWHTGWDGLLAEQRGALDEFWGQADVEVDGDPELQQAVRFSLFHLLQAGARAERRPIPAKGLTGPGYDGHAFWDTEAFVLRVLSLTAPSAARDALAWRHSILGLAEERAALLGLRGGAFPWRTIAGPECSAYWPAGTAAFHVSAAVSDAAVRHWAATGDEEFDRDILVDLVVSTARLWRSLGYFDPTGAFRIDGVTGPDEYSAISDNNVYTNLMARANLLQAAAAAERHPDRVGDVSAEEIAGWRRAAQAMVVPYDERLRVHQQAEGFTAHDRWDFDATAASQYPLLLHFPYFDLYRKQVVKQPDLVLALYSAGDQFDDEEKARNFDYYEALTVRDSSLSACTQAIMAAETGCLDLAHDYWGEAALMDLEDLEHNTRDGLHLAALSGAWLVAVAGFGGMRDFGGRLSFRPRLPPGLDRLAFHLVWRGSRLRVEIDPGSVTYRCLEGGPVELAHDGASMVVDKGEERTVALRPIVLRPRPAQPPGREPRRRPGPPAPAGAREGPASDRSPA